MNEVNQSARNKGGRPKKAICRSEQLAVMCTLIERKVIESKAKSLSVSISQYLRELGIKGQAVIRSKMLPKEILLLMGTLNHAAANLNQIAKKRNRNEELNALERAQLQYLRTELARLATEIKRQYQ